MGANLGTFQFIHQGEVAIEVAKRAVERYHERLHQSTRRTRSRQLEEVVKEINDYTRGWIGYFRLADTE